MAVNEESNYMDRTGADSVTDGLQTDRPRPDTLSTADAYSGRYPISATYGCTVDIADSEECLAITAINTDGSYAFAVPKSNRSTHTEPPSEPYSESDAITLGNGNTIAAKPLANGERIRGAKSIPRALCHTH